MTIQDVLNYVRNREHAGQAFLFTDEMLDAVRDQMVKVGYEVEHVNGRIGDFLSVTEVADGEDQLYGAIVGSVLESTKFRSWLKADGSIRVPELAQDDMDRYWALHSLMGEEALHSLIEDCQFMGDDAGWFKIGSNENSRGRGLQQAIADFFTLVLLRDWEYQHKLNRRRWAGLRKRPVSGDSKKIYAARFNGAGVPAPKKWSKVASVPTSSHIAYFAVVLANVLYLDVD